MALIRNRHVVWTSCREPHLGQRSCATATTGRTYDRKRSDPLLPPLLQAGGRPHMGLARARPNLRPEMFFLLSKILGFFALPSNLIAVLAVAGVALLFTRFQRAGRRLAVASVVLLLLAGLSPLGNALIYPLEERFPPWDASRGAPTGIVVLGGAIGPDISAARGTPDLNE